MRVGVAAISQSARSLHPPQRVEGRPARCGRLRATRRSSSGPHTGRKSHHVQASSLGAGRQEPLSMPRSTISSTSTPRRRLRVELRRGSFGDSRRRPCSRDSRDSTTGRPSAASIASAYSTGCSTSPPPTTMFASRAVAPGLVIGHAEIGMRRVAAAFDQIDRAVQLAAAVERDGLCAARRIAASAARRTRSRAHECGGIHSPPSLGARLHPRAQVAPIAAISSCQTRSMAGDSSIVLASATRSRCRRPAPERGRERRRASTGSRPRARSA